MTPEEFDKLYDEGNDEGGILDVVTGNAKKIAQTVKGIGPLVIAQVKHGHYDKLLDAMGAGPNVTPGGFTPIYPSDFKKKTLEDVEIRENTAKWIKEDLEKSFPSGGYWDKYGEAMLYGSSDDRAKFQYDWMNLTTKEENTLEEWASDNPWQLEDTPWKTATHFVKAVGKNMLASADFILEGRLPPLLYANIYGQYMNKQKVLAEQMGVPFDEEKAAQNASIISLIETGIYSVGIGNTLKAAAGKGMIKKEAETLLGKLGISSLKAGETVAHMGGPMALGSVVEDVGINMSFQSMDTNAPQISPKEILENSARAFRDGVTLGIGIHTAGMPFRYLANRHLNKAYAKKLKLKQEGKLNEYTEEQNELARQFSEQVDAVASDRFSDSLERLDTKDLLNIANAVGADVGLGSREELIDAIVKNRVKYEPFNELSKKTSLDMLNDYDATKLQKNILKWHIQGEINDMSELSAWRANIESLLEWTKYEGTIDDWADEYLVLFGKFNNGLPDQKFNPHILEEYIKNNLSENIDLTNPRSELEHKILDYMHGNKEHKDFLVGRLGEENVKFLDENSQDIATTLQLHQSRVQGAMDLINSKSKSLDSLLDYYGVNIAKSQGIDTPGIKLAMAIRDSLKLPDTKKEAFIKDLKSMFGDNFNDVLLTFMTYVDLDKSAKQAKGLTPKKKSQVSDNAKSLIDMLRKDRTWHKAINFDLFLPSHYNADSGKITINTFTDLNDLEKVAYHELLHKFSNALDIDKFGKDRFDLVNELMFKLYQVDNAHSPEEIVILVDKILGNKMPTMGMHELLSMYFSDTFNTKPKEEQLEIVGNLLKEFLGEEGFDYLKKHSNEIRPMYTGDVKPVGSFYSTKGDVSEPKIERKNLLNFVKANQKLLDIPAKNADNLSNTELLLRASSIYLDKRGKDWKGVEPLIYEAFGSDLPEPDKMTDSDASSLHLRAKEFVDKNRTFGIERKILRETYPPSFIPNDAKDRLKEAGLLDEDMKNKTSNEIVYDLWKGLEELGLPAFGEKGSDIRNKLRTIYGDEFDKFMTYHRETGVKYTELIEAWDNLKEQRKTPETDRLKKTVDEFLADRKRQKGIKEGNISSYRPWDKSIRVAGDETNPENVALHELLHNLGDESLIYYNLPEMKHIQEVANYLGWLSYMDIHTHDRGEFWHNATSADQALSFDELFSMYFSDKYNQEISLETKSQIRHLLSSVIGEEGVNYLEDKIDELRPKLVSKEPLRFASTKIDLLKSGDSESIRTRLGQMVHITEFKNKPSVRALIEGLNILNVPKSDIDFVLGTETKTSKDSLYRLLSEYLENKSQDNQIMLVAEEILGAENARWLKDNWGNMVLNNPRDIYGVTRFLDSGKIIIDLLKGGDLLTLSHEFMHAISPWLHSDVRDEIINMLMEDKHGHLKGAVRNGVEAKYRRVWDEFQADPFSKRNPKDVQALVDMQEALAESFEKYLATEEAPIHTARPLFASIKARIKKNYSDIRKGQLKRFKMSEKMSEIFDKMFTNDMDIPREKAFTVTLEDPETGEQVEYSVLKSRVQIAAHKTIMSYIKRANAELLGIHDRVHEYIDMLIPEEHEDSRQRLHNEVDGIETRHKAITFLKKIDTELAKIQKREKKLAIKDFKSTVKNAKKARLSDDLQKALEKTIDFISTESLSERNVRKTVGAERALKEWKQNLDRGLAEVPEEVKLLTPELLKKVENSYKTHINELSTDDIRLLTEGIQQLIDYNDFQIKAAMEKDKEIMNKRYEEGQRENRANWRYRKSKRRTNLQIKNDKELSRIGKTYKAEMTSYLTLMDIMADGIKGGFWGTLASELREGRTREYEIRQQFRSFLQSIYDAVDVDGVSTAIGKTDSNQFATIKVGGKDVKLPLSYLMLFYGYTKNKYAKKKLLKNGFRPDFDKTKLFKFDSEEELFTALQNLSPELKDAVDSVIKYYDEVVYPTANETYKKLNYGLSLPKEENYLPLFIEYQSRYSTEYLNLKNLGDVKQRWLHRHIQSLAFLNARMGGEQPLYAKDFFGAVGENMYKVAFYSGMAEPITRGKFLLFGNKLEGIHKQLIEMWGEEKTHWMEKFFEGLEDPSYRSEKDTFFSASRRIREGTRGQLAGSLPVMMYQLASVVFGKNYDGIKSRHLLTGILRGKSIKELMEYDPFLRERFTVTPSMYMNDESYSHLARGMWATEEPLRRKFAEINNFQSAKEFLRAVDDKIAYGITFMDSRAVSSIIYAGEKAGKSKQEIMDIIMRSQPTNDPLFTSSFLSTKNLLKKLSFGVFETARDGARRELQYRVWRAQNRMHGQGEGSAAKEMAKVIGSLAATSGIITAVQTAFVKASSDEDYGNELPVILFLSNILGLYAYFGSWGAAGLKGSVLHWDSTLGELPILSTGTSLFKNTYAAGKNYIEGDYDKGDEFAIKAAEDFARLNGSSLGNISKLIRTINKENR